MLLKASRNSMWCGMISSSLLRSAFLNAGTAAFAAGWSRSLIPAAASVRAWSSSDLSAFASARVADCLSMERSAISRSAIPESALNGISGSSKAASSRTISSSASCGVRS